MRYIPTTKKDQEEMLASIGVSSLDELFEDIPQHMRLKHSLPLPKGMAEADLARHMRALSEKNINMEHVVSFLGAGAYEHLIPSVVKHITNRGEFLTAYTPYQAEISQGVLQCIFEFQTLITEITGMEAANASMYDGATALAEAALMACNATRRNSVLLPDNLHPEWKDVVCLYLRNQNVEVTFVPYDQKTGTIDLEKATEIITDQASCMVVQNPNFFGLLENVQPLSDAIHKHGGLLVMAVDPISLGVIKSPGEYGADIAVGDGQPLGNPLSFGGPSVGFFAASGQKLIRRMPGRIVGETVDKDNRRGYVLTLQTREQHIRREKATSNICSNQALNALAVTVYLSVIGKQGFKDVATQCLQKTAYLQNKLADLGFEKAFSAPFFREFVVKGNKNWNEVNIRLLEHGFLGGLPLGELFSPLSGCALLGVTEARTKDEIDRFAHVLGGLSI